MFYAICPGCEATNKHQDHKYTSMVKCPSCRTSYHGSNGAARYAEKKKDIELKELAHLQQLANEALEKQIELQELAAKRRKVLIIFWVGLFLLLWVMGLIVKIFNLNEDKPKPQPPKPVPVTFPEPYRPVPVTKPKPEPQTIIQAERVTSDDRSNKAMNDTAKQALEELSQKTKERLPQRPTTEPAMTPQEVVENIENESLKIDKLMMQYEIDLYEFLAMTKFDLAQRTSRQAKSLYSLGERQNCYRLDKECGFLYERVIIEYPHSQAAALTRQHADARTLAEYENPKRPQLPSGVTTSAKDPKQPSIRSSVVIREYSYKGVTVHQHVVEREKNETGKSDTKKSNKESPK